MKTISRLLQLVLVGAAFVVAGPVKADSGTTPDFNELRSVLLEHLSGATEAQLNQAAVKGLLGELKGRVTLVPDGGEATTNAPLLVTAERRFDGGIGYVRVQDIAAGLDGAVALAAGRLMTSNRLTGLVLDLRYAQGSDYGSAASVVNLFLAEEVPLLNAGKGLVSSKAKTNAINLPVVALINGKTTAAAEALAAMLRQSGVGLLIGTATAGRAGVTSDYQLTTGQKLRVVTAPVQLGDAKALSSEGVTPDVEVTIKPDEESVFYADPFAHSNGASGGNQPSFAMETDTSAKRLRVTEADLVREKRGDGDLETLAGERVKSEESSPKVTDPALARAIDLLKGLEVVRQWKF